MKLQKFSEWLDACEMEVLNEHVDTVCSYLEQMSIYRGNGISVKDFVLSALADEQGIDLTAEPLGYELQTMLDKLEGKLEAQVPLCVGLVLDTSNDQGK